MAKVNGVSAFKPKSRVKGSNHNNSRAKPAGIASIKGTSFSKRALSKKVPSGVPIRRAVDLILNKGIIIDAWISLAIIGIRIMDIDAEVSIRSLDTYIRYADAMGRTGHTAVPVAAIVV